MEPFQTSSSDRFETIKSQGTVEFYSNNHSYPDTVIKAITDLHKIELSIFNIWKRLPIITFDLKQKQLTNSDQREVNKEEYLKLCLLKFHNSTTLFAFFFCDLILRFNTKKSY
jgi:hypothetical protein